MMHVPHPNLKCGTARLILLTNVSLNYRSTCTQRPETHLFYNAVIMDRAHNRRLVGKQLKALETRRNIKRDPEYMFVQYDN